MAGDLSKFCSAMRWAADSNQVGYSQSDRASLKPSDFFGSGKYNTDCSALVITALKYAGFDTGGASYTGNMSANLTARGWKRISPTSALKAGDILLNDANHVAVWLGDCLAQASIDEHGGIAGGARGDQTGSEVNTRSFYSYPWDCILRHVASSGGSSTTSDNPSATGSQPRYRAMVNAHWLDEMVGLADTGGSGEDFAGETGVGIQFLAVQGVGKYRACTQMGGWLDWVSGYDTGDLDKGCAGDGSAITKLEIPNAKVKYQVHSIANGWFAWMVGQHDTGGSSDTFAGDGTPIDMVRICLA